MQRTYVLLKEYSGNILYWYKYIYWQEMKNYVKFIKKTILSKCLLSNWPFL